MTRNHEWILVSMHVDGEARVYRVRQEIPAGIEKAEYANCVVIEWKSPGDALPDKPLQEAHKTLERFLDPLADDNPNSLMMHVYTKAGMKEWCYYARDYDRFMAELNVALTGKPRFPIEILKDDDPTWNYWSTIKDFSNSAPTE